jgi:H+/gluconate symporter-like permease
LKQISATKLTNGKSIMASNPNDPLGLFGGGAARQATPPTTAPVLVVSSPEPAKPKTDWAGVILGILIGIVAMLAYDRFVIGGQGNRQGDRQDQQQIDDRQDKKQDQKEQSKPAGKTLVFIHERNPQSIEIGRAHV